MNNVLVTGANGFIGSSLISTLVDLGVNVVAIDISFQSTRLPESKLITKIECGLLDIESVYANIPNLDYDCLYHFAWMGVNGPQKADPTVQLQNIQMAINSATLAKRLGCKKVLFAGTIAEQSMHSLADLETTSGGMIYGAAKHCCHIMVETYCKNIGQPFVWMQFSNIYGVGNRTGNLVSYTLETLMRGEDATFGPACQPYDFIYVDDLIEAIYRLGDKQTNKNFYYIGSGRPRLLKEFLLEIGDAMSMTNRIVIGARPDDGIKYEYEMFDINNTVNDIGNYVNVSFSEGVQKTISWLRNEL